MKIGDKIRERREQLGYTQEELALKLGYASRSSVNKVENSREVSMKKLKMYAEALNTTVAFLMGWEEEFTVASAKIDAQLTMADGETKEYMLKFANLPTEKKKHIMDLIDMFE